MRQLYEVWLRESLGRADALAAQFDSESPEVEVEWLRPQPLAYRILLFDASISLTRPTGLRYQQRSLGWRKSAATRTCALHLLR
jgi:hypothetical protein